MTPLLLLLVEISGPSSSRHSCPLSSMSGSSSNRTFCPLRRDNWAPDFGGRCFFYIHNVSSAGNNALLLVSDRTSEAKLWRFVLSWRKIWQMRPLIMSWRCLHLNTWRPTPKQTTRTYLKPNTIKVQPCAKVCYHTDIFSASSFWHNIYPDLW